MRCFISLERMRTCEKDISYKLSVQHRIVDAHGNETAMSAEKGQESWSRVEPLVSTGFNPGNQPIEDEDKHEASPPIAVGTGPGFGLSHA
jgi:hypothetical protein